MPPRTEGRGRGRAPASVLPAGLSSSGLKPASAASLAPNGAEAEFHRQRQEREARRDALINEGSIQDPGQARPLGGAQDLVGTCEAMCPAYELVEREMQREIDPLEQGGAPPVKIYRRPAAGREVPFPEDVRPPRVLLKTLDYLFHDLLPSDPYHPSFNQIQAFVWNRTRAVRQDFVVQNVHGAEAIEAHERISRYHILILHFRGGLVEADGQVVENPRNADGTKAQNTWSQQQELEQLRKTLRSLVEYYDDARHDRTESQDRGAPVSPHEGEFRAYQLLLGAYDPEALREVEVLPGPVLDHPILQSALKIRALIQGCGPVALRRADTASLPAHGLAFFARFFSLVARQETDYLLGCIAEELFADVRRAGLRALARASKTKDTPPICWITQALGFDDDAQVLSLAEQLDVQPRVDDSTGTQYLELVHAVIAAGKPIKTPFSRALEVKRQGRTCQQIIDQPGTAAPSQPIALPEVSVDASSAPARAAPGAGGMLARLEGAPGSGSTAELLKLNPYASSFVPRAQPPASDLKVSTKAPAPAPGLANSKPTGTFSAAAAAAAPTTGIGGKLSAFGPQLQNAPTVPPNTYDPASRPACTAPDRLTAFAPTGTHQGGANGLGFSALLPGSGSEAKLQLPLNPNPLETTEPAGSVPASASSFARNQTSSWTVKPPEASGMISGTSASKFSFPPASHAPAWAQTQTKPMSTILEDNPSSQFKMPSFSLGPSPGGDGPTDLPAALPPPVGVSAFDSEQPQPLQATLPSWQVTRKQSLPAAVPGHGPAVPAAHAPKRPSAAQEQEIRTRLCQRIYLRIARVVTKRPVQQAAEAGQTRAAEALHRRRIAAALYARMAPVAVSAVAQRACTVVAANKYRAARLLSGSFSVWRSRLRRKRWNEVLARVERVRERAVVPRAPREGRTADCTLEAVDDAQLAHSFAERRKLRDALWARGQFTLLVYERVGETADLYADLWPDVTDVLCSFSSVDEGGSAALSEYLRNALADDELQIINKHHVLRVRAFPPPASEASEGSVLMSLVECSPASEAAWADTRSRIAALTRHVESQRKPGRWYPKLLILAWPGLGREQTILDRLQPDLGLWPGGENQVHIVHLDPSQPTYSRVDSGPDPERLARLFDSGFSHLLRRVQFASRPPEDDVTVRSVHGFAKPLLVEWRAALISVQRSYEQLDALCTTDELVHTAVSQVCTLWLAGLHSANLLLTFILRYSKTLIDEDEFVLLPIAAVDLASSRTLSDALWLLSVHTVDASLQTRLFPGLDLLAAQLHSAYAARLGMSLSFLSLLPSCSLLFPSAFPPRFPAAHSPD